MTIMDFRGAPIKIALLNFIWDKNSVYELLKVTSFY